MKSTHLCAPLKQQSAEVRNISATPRSPVYETFQALAKNDPNLRCLVPYRTLAQLASSAASKLTLQPRRCWPCRAVFDRCTPALAALHLRCHRLRITVLIAALTHHCSSARAATGRCVTVLILQPRFRIACTLTHHCSTGPRCQRQYSFSLGKPQPCSRHCRRAG